LSKVLKNSYVRIAIFYIVLLLSFWFIPRIVLRTNYPLLTVASGSMIPTLQVGDLIVVQGVSDASEINAAPKPDGTMIVFYRPGIPRSDGILFFTDYELIVHRAIKKVENNGTWYFQTKGDNSLTNQLPDTWYGPDTWNGMISSKLLVGKVVAVAPWIGNVPLFMRTSQGTILVFILFILLIISFFAEYIPFRSKKKTTTKG